MKEEMSPAPLPTKEKGGTLVSGLQQKRQEAYSLQAGKWGSFPERERNRKILPPSAFIFPEKI